MGAANRARAALVEILAHVETRALPRRYADHQAYGNNMERGQSGRRSDEQLEAMLWETGHWVIKGQQGRVLGSAANLRQAIERSVVYAVSGAVVVAICRLPSDNIVVLPRQIARLRKAIAADEAARDRQPHAA
jgi:hypothetical protein